MNFNIIEELNYCKKLNITENLKMSNFNKSLVQSMENICTEDEDFIISEDKLLCKPCSVSDDQL